MRKAVLAASAAVVALCGLSASSTSAQLIVGGTSGTVAPSYYIDITTDPANPRAFSLWPGTASGNKINGVAADDVNRKLYNNDAARLSVRAYGPSTSNPTFIAGMFRTNGTTTSATGFDDIVSVNGTLYGYTTFASSTFRRGIYQIPTTPNASNQLITTPVWLDPFSTTTPYAFGGITYNPANGLFYGLNSSNTAPGGAGIYTIDALGAGTVTRIANLPNLTGVFGVGLPSGYTGWDGLALGAGGRLYLTTHDRVGLQILITSYNLNTSAYDTSFGVVALGYNDGTQRATGASWTNDTRFIPEPAAAMTLLPAATLVARRRRK